MTSPSKKEAISPQVRVLRLIEILSIDVMRGMKQTEIVSRTNWKRSNVVRDLVTLESEGYIKKNNLGFYCLTSQWHAIALRYEQQMTTAQQQLQENVIGVQARARQLGA